jgi:hypothetical protein
MPCRSLNYIPENCSPGSCQSPYPYRCSFQSCSFQRCGRARLTHLARRHTAMEAHHVSRLGSVRGRCGRQDQWRNCGAAGPGGWPPGSRGYYLGRHSPRGQGRRQISVCDSAWRSDRQSQPARRQRHRCQRYECGANDCPATQNRRAGQIRSVVESAHR